MRGFCVNWPIFSFPDHFTTPMMADLSGMREIGERTVMLSIPSNRSE